MEPNIESNDILIPEDRYVRAEAGKRFVNYFVDIIVFYIVIFAGGFIVGLLNPEALDNLAEESGYGIVDRIIFLGMYAIYMGTVEGLFKGKSVGKLITRTKAVNLDGSRIGWKEAFARGFSRAVPLCVFSAFGTPCDPWQDKWTSTMVIDDVRSLKY
jgi:uncharacterized RDD family membrane protein YckC